MVRLLNVIISFLNHEFMVIMRLCFPIYLINSRLTHLFNYRMGRKSIWKVTYIHMWYTFILYIQIHTLHTYTKGLRVYSQKCIIKIILLCNFVDIITKSILTWYARIYLHLYQYINIMITCDILNFLYKQFTPPRKVKYWVYKTGAVNHCRQTRATIAQGSPCSSKKN